MILRKSSTLTMVLLTDSRLFISYFTSERAGGNSTTLPMTVLFKKQPCSLKGIQYLIRYADNLDLINKLVVWREAEY